MAHQKRLQLFLEALRSGKYEQGSSVLSRVTADGTVKHCCLGVAVQVAIDNGFPIRVSDKISDIPDGTEEKALLYVDDLGSCYRGLLPKPLMEWYGFSAPQVRYANDSQRDSDVHLTWADADATSATVLNDEMSLDFGDIADAFERTYGENR